MSVFDKHPLPWDKDISTDSFIRYIYDARGGAVLYLSDRDELTSADWKEILDRLNATAKPTLLDSVQNLLEAVPYVQPSSPFPELQEPK